MQDTAPQWSEIHAKLSRVQTVAGAKARRQALRDVVDDIIAVFENWAPTEWEAHFLLHAIHHIEAGFLVAAAEEIASVLKPRHQQTCGEFISRRSQAHLPPTGEKQASGGAIG